METEGGAPRRTGELDRMLGDPGKAIRTMASSLVIALAFAQVNTFADAFWVAGLGSDAAEAVTTVNPIYTLLTCAGVGLGVGANATVAYRLGRGEREEAERLAGAILELAAVLSVLSALALYFLYDPLMDMMGAESVRDVGFEYVLPLLCSAVFIALNQVVGGLLRSEGAGKKSMKTQIAVLVLNVCLDPVLIYGADMGVAGAGIATGISCIAGTLLGLSWFLRRTMSIDIDARHLLADRAHLKEVLQVSAPRTGESALSGIADMAMRVVLIVAGGVTANMLYAYPWRYVTLSGMPSSAVYSAMVSVSSGNLGKGDVDNARRACVYALRTCLVWSLALAILIAILAWPLMEFLANGESMGTHMDVFAWTLRLEAVTIPCTAVMGVGAAMLQAMRRSRLSLGLYLAWTVSKISACLAAAGVSYEAVITALVAVSLCGAAVFIAVAWTAWSRDASRLAGEAPVFGNL